MTLLPAARPEETPDDYEAEHVHEVYQHIAPHFSATRFKPWPVVESFLKNLEPGSVGLDIGCGNGKYLTVNPDVYMIGSDRSSNLVEIAYGRKLVHDAFVADALDLPHPEGRFDFAISIAVIHHFSSPERRIEAVRSILGTLKEGGKALIYVWALEQKNSRRGYDEGQPQDVFVPWVLQKQYQKPAKKEGVENAAEEGNEGEEQPKEKTYQRYYHLYRQGELEGDIAAAGGVVIESGYQKDNWWAICGPGVKPSE